MLGGGAEAMTTPRTHRKTHFLIKSILAVVFSVGVLCGAAIVAAVLR